MIDPQGQMNLWIKNLEIKNDLKVISASNTQDIEKDLEQAVRMGLPCLVESVEEELHPALEMLLSRVVTKKGDIKMIALADNKIIPYDDNFRLYLTSGLAKPEFSAAVYSKATVINCTVTQQALEDQFLSQVVQQTRPELEEQKYRLAVSINSDRKQLRQLEENILSMVTQGDDLLNDESLITSLRDAKSTASLLEKRISDSELTEQDINLARREFEDIAIRMSHLYLVVSSLTAINHMYQFSLAYFSRLYGSTLKHYQGLQDADVDYVGEMMVITTEVLYRHISWGLFEQDRLIFGFMLLIRLLLEAGDIENADWDVFLRGRSLLRRYSKIPKNPDESWISEAMWQWCVVLNHEVPAFHGLCKNIEENLGQWVSLGIG
eukprot:TRINITY_DN5621_c0_g1_i1.p1 TRINITY_DN5621_c0_g1~~TRINITY_DN5621_c0_g1_i1.p1  ORF type:complete len:379 (-),score=109.55 TRINITY_DN5621_c0_g1_i1:33-1169(-)